LPSDPHPPEETKKGHGTQKLRDARDDKYPRPGRSTARVKRVGVFGSDTGITVEAMV
jgi:hypothetical protein